MFPYLISQIWSHFAKSSTPNPCSYEEPLWGYVLTQNNPNNIQNHPFSWPELEMGKMNYHLGNLGQWAPTWQCVKYVWIF